MKIAAKIRLSHFLLGLTVLAVGVIGYLSVGRVATQYERALWQTLPVVDALRGVRFQAEHIMAIAYRRQPGAEGADNADEPAEGGADELGSAFEALDHEIARHRGLVETYFPDEREVAEALAREGARLREAALRMTRAPVGTPSGHAARDALRQAIDEITEATKDALVEEEAELERYQAQIDELRRSLQWSVLAFTVAAFGVALLVGGYASRRVARPIAALRDVARRFARRDLSVRATPQAVDEVGELANAFNEMAQALGDTMVSRAFVENVLARIADGVLVLDETGRIRRANPAAAELLGRTEADLRDRPARELLGAAAGDGVVVPWPTPGNPVDIVLRRPSAEPAHLQVALAPLIEDGQRAGAVLTLHDTTALRRVEREMQQRMGELQDINRNSPRCTR